MRIPNRRAGILVLGVWLIAQGALQLAPTLLNFSGSASLLALLAIAAGILVLMDR